MMWSDKLVKGLLVAVVVIMLGAATASAEPLRGPESLPKVEEVLARPVLRQHPPIRIGHHWRSHRGLNLSQQDFLAPPLRDQSGVRHVVGHRLGQYDGGFGRRLGRTCWGRSRRAGLRDWRMGGRGRNGRRLGVDRSGLRRYVRRFWGARTPRGFGAASRRRGILRRLIASGQVELGVRNLDDGAAVILRSKTDAIAQRLTKMARRLDKLLGKRVGVEKDGHPEERERATDIRSGKREGARRRQERILREKREKSLERTHRDRK